LETVLDRHPQYLSNHLQQTYEIIFIIAGTGYHIVDGAQYLLHPGCIYCAGPGHEHRITAEEGISGFLISFTGAFLDLDNDHEVLPDAIMYNLFNNCPTLEITKEAAEDISDVLALLLKEVSKYSLLRAEIVRRLLRIVLYYFKQQMKHEMYFEQGGPGCTLVNNFFLLLEENFIEKREVSHYAKELFVSPNYLNHCIKKNTGFTARYHIAQRIISEAKRKMHDNRITMKQLAYTLGFDDACHFSRFFKKGTGYNFTQFRRMHSVYTS
jgi:AraC-like DNA-binding protein